MGPSKRFAVKASAGWSRIGGNCFAKGSQLTQVIPLPFLHQASVILRQERRLGLSELRNNPLIFAVVGTVRWGIRTFSQKPQIENLKALNTYHAQEAHAQ